MCAFNFVCNHHFGSLTGEAAAGSSCERARILWKQRSLTSAALTRLLQPAASALRATLLAAVAAAHGARRGPTTHGAAIARGRSRQSASIRAQRTATDDAETARGRAGRSGLGRDQTTADGAPQVLLSAVSTCRAMIQCILRPTAGRTRTDAYLLARLRLEKIAAAGGTHVLAALRRRLTGTSGRQQERETAVVVTAAPSRQRRARRRDERDHRQLSRVVTVRRDVASRRHAVPAVPAAGASVRAVSKVVHLVDCSTGARV